MISTDKQKHSLVKISLAASALMVGINAQTACSTKSPQCCWVVRIWQLMGKTTSIKGSSTTGCCAMEGVTCSGTTVTGIQWGWIGLKNSFPIDVTRLVNLTILEFPANELTGPIPKEIGKLVNLETFELYANQFSGSLPTEIGALVNLKFLGLAVNQFTGSIPASIGNLVKLERMNVGDNKFSGAIPAEIGKLVNLQELLSEYNIPGFTSIPSSIGNLRKLKILNLSINRLTGQIPASISNLTNLQDLALYNNQLTGTIPPGIALLVNLESLNLAANRLTGTIPNLGTLTNLKVLSLPYNAFSPGPFPSWIGNLSQLTSIDIRSNHDWRMLYGEIPAFLWSLVSLREIWLSDNDLTGSIPSAIGNLVNLRRLFLTGNHFHGELPKELGNLNLYDIFMNDNVNLSGTYRPPCGIAESNVANTQVVICGCASSSNLPSIFAPPSIPAECLATGPAPSLRKRAAVFSLALGEYLYTCNKDAKSNPYGDCLNSMAAICNSEYMGTDPERLTTCRKAVDRINQQLNPDWQKVRRECGQWKWTDGFTGSNTSVACINANKDLQQKAYYLDSFGNQIFVSAALTNSVNFGLWGNRRLQ